MSSFVVRLVCLGAIVAGPRRVFVGAKLKGDALMELSTCML